jgi:hypothetical protein
MAYETTITMRDESGVEMSLDACIFAARPEGRVSYRVTRRGNGQVTFTLSGDRLDVEKVYDVGSKTRLW